MDKYTIYNQRKQTFIYLNNPTQEELDTFCKKLAKELGI